jgi:hypothetical protein
MDWKIQIWISEQHSLFQRKAFIHQLCLGKSHVNLWQKPTENLVLKRHYRSINLNL